VEDPLSDALLSGQFHDKDTILVDLQGEEVVLVRAESEEAPPPVEEVSAV
jgi:hypothetical protein